MTSENNAYSALLSLIKAIKIKAVNSNIKEMLFTNPNFPSIASLSDILDRLNVENIVVKVNPSQLNELPLPSIAFMNEGEYVTILNIKNNFVTYNLNTKIVTENVDTFIYKWSGVILLVEPNEKSGDSNYRNNKLKEVFNYSLRGLLYFFASFLFIYITVFSINYFNRVENLLMINKVIGIFISILIFIISNNYDKGNLKSFCNINEVFDCSHTLLFKKHVFRYISWQDLSLIYFTSGYLFLCTDIFYINNIENAINIMRLFNFISIPFIVYSLYFQIIKTKKICLLCMSIVVLLVKELLIINYAYPIHNIYYGKQVYLLISLLFLITIVWLLLKNNIIKSYKLKTVNLELLKMKYDSDYLKVAFTDQRPMPPIFDGMITHKIESKVKSTNVVTIITNPLCNPCKELHNEIKNISQIYKNVTFQFIFLTSGKGVPIVENIFCLNDSDFEIALDEWFSLKDSKKWIAKYSYAYSEEIAKVQMSFHSRWCEMTNIRTTPTVFINGIQLPKKYSISDVSNIYSNYSFV